MIIIRKQIHLPYIESKRLDKLQQDLLDRLVNTWGGIAKLEEIEKWIDTL